MLRRVLSTLSVLLLAAPAVAGEGPELEQTSIVVSTTNRAKDEATFVWTPKIAFKVYGPVAAGVTYAVDFSTTDGKPWVTVQLEAPELPAGQSGVVASGDGDIALDKGAGAAGDLPFAIRLGDKVVFKGTAKVKKFHVNGAIAKYKNSFYYYVDQDWRLPVGEIWWNVKEDAEAPALMAAIWLRGGTKPNDAATLAFDGKTYCSTTAPGKGEVHEMTTIETSYGPDQVKWTQVVMWFNCTRAFNKHTDGAVDASFHIADKHPGKYQVTLMRDGKPVRQADLDIGADGKLVDSGVSQKNHLGGHKDIVGFKLVGDADGKVDATAWKSGIYGNPLAGFEP
jgi:hypothetical protein